MAHETPKKPIAAWKIWLGIFLAILVGAGTGIAILLLSKALVLLTSILAWLAPFFVMALIGAVLLAQIAAVLALFTMDLDPITEKRLLWIGVYSLPLSGAGLTLLLAYTAFGAVALSPLFGASFVGLVFGVIVAGYIHYKIKKLPVNSNYEKFGQNSSTPPDDAPSAKELKKPNPTTAPVKLPKKELKELTVWDYADAKHFDVQKFIGGLKTKLQEMKLSQGVYNPGFAFYMISENKLEELKKCHSKEELLVKNNKEPRLRGSSLVYFAVLLKADADQGISAASDFFKEGVSKETLETLQKGQKELLTDLEKTTISRSDPEYQSKSEAKPIEKAALTYLGEKLEEALKLKSTPSLPL